MPRSRFVLRQVDSSQRLGQIVTNTNPSSQPDGSCRLVGVISLWTMHRRFAGPSSEDDVEEALIRKMMGRPCVQFDLGRKSHMALHQSRHGAPTDPLAAVIIREKWVPVPSYR